MVGLLRPSEVVDDLQLLEVIGIDVGLDRLRRVAHLQRVTDFICIKPRHSYCINLRSDGCAPKIKQVAFCFLQVIVFHKKNSIKKAL